MQDKTGLGLPKNRALRKLVSHVDLKSFDIHPTREDKRCL